MRAQYQQNITIQGCAFDGQNANVYGIVMYSDTHVRLSHNTFQNLGNSAVTSFPGGDWNDVEIDGNRFTTAGQYNTNSGAIQLLSQSGASGSSNIRIHDNTCDNTAQYTGCFKFAANSAKPVKLLSVTDNVLSYASNSNETLAIELFSSDNTDVSFQQFTIAHNLINAAWGSSQAYCISAYGMRGVISGNTLSGCFDIGIEVLASNTSVLGNTLSYTGPIVWNAGGVARSAVVISGNSIFKSYGNGIQILGGANGAISDGVLSNNVILTPDHGDGVLIQTLSNGSLRDIHIDNNLFELPNGGYAIHSEGTGSQVQIENNRFANIAGDGLFLNSGGSSFTIRFNNFSGAGSWVQNFGTSITRSVENIVNGGCCY